MATYDEIRAHLDKKLPKVSKKAREELADWIHDLDPTEDGEGLTVVHVEGARAAISRTEAYGLEFEVDANGNATTVHFPYGAFVA